MRYMGTCNSHRARGFESWLAPSALIRRCRRCRSATRVVDADAGYAEFLDSFHMMIKRMAASIELEPILLRVAIATLVFESRFPRDASRRRPRRC